MVVVAARKAMIERFVEGVRGAGLKPEGIDLNAFALVRALAKNQPEVADAAPGATDLAAAGPRLLPPRRRDQPGRRRRRRSASSPARSRPIGSEEGDMVASALAEEIRLSIDFYMAQPDARAVGEVLLSGPGLRHRRASPTSCPR